MSRLLLIRHAQAAAPDDLRLPGIDLPLLPQGRRQAAALAVRLAALRPAAVWTSDARRARETAAVVAERCGLPLGLQPGLRELHFGEWGGRTYAEVVAADPAAAGWFADPATGAPPGGEFPADAAARVLAELADLAGGADGPAIVVGHSGSLRLALATALGMPLAAAWRLRLDCAGVSVLDWTADGPVVERLNDTGHVPGLAGAGGPGGPAINDRADEESPLKGADDGVSGVRVDGAGIEANRAGGDQPDLNGTVESVVRQDEGAGERAGGTAVTLILGGARSGKSTLAERLAAESGRPVLYLATSVPFDEEMRERIAAHRADRPAGWRTIEEPLRIAAAVREHARPGDLVLLDCLTVWLSNLLLNGIGPDRDPDAVPAAAWNALEAAALAEIDVLLAAARARGVALVLVSNEVGMGVVPAYPLGRRYRDALGRVNQRLATLADPVLLTVAGLALDLRRLAGRAHEPGTGARHPHAGSD